MTTPDTEPDLCQATCTFTVDPVTNSVIIFRDCPLPMDDCPAKALGIRIVPGKGKVPLNPSLSQLKEIHQGRIAAGADQNITHAGCNAARRRANNP